MSSLRARVVFVCVLFFNDTATTEIYTLSLHDALPISVLIGVGAAAAITAGVIMMSPVEIKGRVVMTDQAAVPGAKISLLREGKVVAQTTADENGSFSLKAKRGSYELTAAYTTADGQLIYKTIDIKAPAKDLTVTF